MAVLCAALGCIQPDLVLCADGLACPAGDRCDDVHRACVAPDQLTVCGGLADGAACLAGPVSGACFDGVCLPRGCGNRVVEAGEMCDDGNQLSGDGCSGDCRSTEQCGNGVVDPGEECDDGNLVSRDGCDSRCLRETAAWRATPIAPIGIDAHQTAFDAARGRLVYVESRAVWEWDGARWTIAPSSAPGRYPFAVVYDPDRGQIDMISSEDGNAFHVYTRSPGAWTQIDSAEGLLPDPDASAPGDLVATYDPVGHRLFVIEICAWDAGWVARVPGLPFRPVGAAYDPITHGLGVLHDARPSDPAAGIELWRLGDAGWEHVAMPHAPPGRDATLAESPVDGSVLYVARGNAGVFAAMMTRTSPTPLESCQAGEDRDGDGLAGCDDPDCFWACALPPPYTARRMR